MAATSLKDGSSYASSSQGDALVPVFFLRCPKALQLSSADLRRGVELYFRVGRLLACSELSDAQLPACKHYLRTSSVLPYGKVSVALGRPGTVTYFVVCIESG
jgi:hypothetical protein